MQYLVLYIGAFIVCIFIGGHIIEYAITGILTLASFVLIIESMPSLKWFIHKTNKLVDILIFCFAIYAKIHFGVTIAMALMFAGLGFTMLYAPWIRETYNEGK
jgi:hypothetical protein